jgi:hypothetical protein
MDDARGKAAVQRVAADAGPDYETIDRYPL